MVPENDAFVQKMKKRFRAYLQSDDPETVGEIEMFIHGSQQYEIEEEAEAFVESRPHATARELFEFFNATAPEGLAPGDDGADLLED